MRGGWPTTQAASPPPTGAGTTSLVGKRVCVAGRVGRVHADACAKRACRQLPPPTHPILRTHSDVALLRWSDQAVRQRAGGEQQQQQQQRPPPRTRARVLAPRSVARLPAAHLAPHHPSPPPAPSAPHTPQPGVVSHARAGAHHPIWRHAGGGEGAGLRGRLLRLGPRWVGGWGGSGWLVGEGGQRTMHSACRTSCTGGGTPPHPRRAPTPTHPPTHPSPTHPPRRGWRRAGGLGPGVRQSRLFRPDW